MRSHQLKDEKRLRDSAVGLQWFATQVNISQITKESAEISVIGQHQRSGQYLLMSIHRLVSQLSYTGKHYTSQ
jgi:hypothetical protein